MREIKDEKLSAVIVNKLNKCCIHLCSGRFDLAREGFDEVITYPPQQGGLGLKEIVSDSSVDGYLPSYLVSLLSYFYLRTKNYKMARALVKGRRFLIN